MKTQHTHYSRLPWRVVKNDEGTWDIWTRFDEPPGSRNNYQIASGIQNEDEAKVLTAAPELLEAAKIGLACCIAWGGKCEAKGENILAIESVKQSEIIRAAIAKATLL